MKFILSTLFLLSTAANAITLSDWKKLPKAKKIEILKYDSPQVEVLLNKNKITKNELSAERQKLLKSQLKEVVKKLSEFKTELETEVEDDMHGIVGEVEKTANVFISDDNHFLGAQIYYFQNGCDHQDENGEYVEEGGNYRTMTEAKKNKCYENDVNWGGHSLIDQNFKELEHSEYMEWSGY